MDSSPEERRETQARPILEKDRNCWRLERADRFKLLIDGAAYFAALREALLAARRQVIIIGWDVDSRVRLVRDAAPDGARGRRGEAPETLRELLNFIVETRPGLKVHILLWDFSVFMAPAREPLPLINLDWRTWPEVSVHLDGTVPFGAAHHQKIVSIDDRLAFVGGIDLTEYRWDTPAHAANDPRRITSSGEPYGPFHDVQAMFDGRAAAAIGELARERWALARGETLLMPSSDADVWPHQAVPDLRQVDIAISRTQPEGVGRKAVREVERLYLDSIAAARESIYIENQYLTADSIADALAARLADPSGPEVVIVVPLACSGWLEEQTMGARRLEFLKKVGLADRYHRLRAYRPSLGDAADTMVNVHAKVMIVDDQLLRVGSSNLNNRSMGFDTECDVAIEAGADTAVGDAVRSLRARLLAEHLGREEQAVLREIAESGSIITAIERLRGPGRTLLPIDCLPGISSETLQTLAAIADPERPGDLQYLVERLSQEDGGGSAPAAVRWSLLGGIVAVFFGLTLAWRFTALSEYLDPNVAGRWLELIQSSGWAPAAAIGLFLIGGLLMFPVTVLIAATAIAFDPLEALAYAGAGSLLSALAIYGLGKLVSRRMVRRLAGRRIARVSRKLANNGVVGVMLMRTLPVAPFTVVNLIAGASGVPAFQYVIGTVLGMAPGIALMTALGNRLQQLWLQPSMLNLGILASVMLLWFGFGLMLQRLLGGMAPRNAGTDHPPAFEGAAAQTSK